MQSHLLKTIKKLHIFSLINYVALMVSVLGTVIAIYGYLHGYDIFEKYSFRLFFMFVFVFIVLSEYNNALAVSSKQNNVIYTSYNSIKYLLTIFTVVIAINNWKKELMSKNELAARQNEIGQQQALEMSRQTKQLKELEDAQARSEKLHNIDRVKSIVTKKYNSVNFLISYIEDNISAATLSDFKEKSAQGEIPALSSIDVNTIKDYLTERSKLYPDKNFAVNTVNLNLAKSVIQFAIKNDIHGNSRAYFTLKGKGVGVKNKFSKLYYELIDMLDFYDEDFNEKLFLSKLKMFSLSANDYGFMLSLLDQYVKNNSLSMKTEGSKKFMNPEFDKLISSVSPADICIWYALYNSKFDDVDFSKADLSRIQSVYGKSSSGKGKRLYSYIDNRAGSRARKLLNLIA